MANVQQVRSADGTGIVYRAWGERGRRVVVLIHGWAQSSACWGDAVVRPLAERYRVVAVDLRGHGYSDAPADGYDDPERWAADIAAVLAEEDTGPGVVLVGWSYGGLVACHYLAAAVADTVAGLVLVGAITGIGRGAAGGQVGSSMRAALPAAMSPDPREAIRALAAMELVAAPIDGVMQQQLFGASLCTPPHARAALFRRTANSDELLATLPMPVLLVHGTADVIVDVASAHHAHSVLPTSELSLWDGVGHAPFLEDSARFVREISAFVDGLS